MVKKRANMKWLKLIAIILTVGVLAHTYYLYGSAEKGISGRATENIEKADINSDWIKKIILSGEWLLVISIFIITLLKAKMEIKAVDEIIVTPKKTKSNISKTDLDLMYEIIKEKKKLKIKTLAKYFKDEESTITEWARVLEEANLLMVHYPTVGEPVVILNEEVKQNES